MPRKSAKTQQYDHELEADRREYDLAPAVTAAQWETLRSLGYHGPTPSTAPQAQYIIDLLTRTRVKVTPVGKGK
jgi:hypothetical protein